MAYDNKLLAEYLFNACQDGRERDVLSLLKRGVDPNAYKGSSDRTALHFASRLTDPLIAQHLVQWGAQMEAITVRGSTPLYTACAHNNQACVEMYLGRHCSRDIKNKYGETPADVARGERYSKLAEFVDNYQFPPRDPLCSYPSIKQLSQLKVPDWRKLGQTIGVSKDQLDTAKSDPLPIAAVFLAAKVKKPELNWKDVVEGLLAVGEYGTAASLCHEEALDGHTPLSVSAYYGWLDLLEYLIDKEGQDPNEPINKEGETILSFACSKGHIGVIDYLIKVKGFDPKGPVNAAGDTLKSLAESIGLTDVLQYLDSLAGSTDRAELVQRYMKKLNDLIADRTNTTWLRYLKMYFIGSSGLGKTTTRNRLTGLIQNLSSLSPQERERCSTFLAECTQVLAIVDDSESAKLVLKASKDLDDEAQMLFAYLYGGKSSETDTPDTSRPEDEQIDASKTSADDPHAQHTLDRAPAQPDTSEAENEINGEPSGATKPSESATPAVGQTKPQQVSITTVDVEQVVTRLRSIIGSGKYAEQLLGKILLNLVDVGGQPGFLEMLPFLSKGPGMFLAFFPLDKDLDEQCEISYEREGDKITPYKATYTIRETLSQILSAIRHHASFDSGITKELGDKIGDLSTVKPVATLVGTFKDRLETKITIAVLKEELSKEFPKATEDEIQAALEHSLPSNASPKVQSSDKAKPSVDQQATTSSQPSAEEQSSEKTKPSVDQQAIPSSQPSAKEQSSDKAKPSVDQQAITSAQPSTEEQSSDRPTPTDDLQRTIDQQLSSESFKAKVNKDLEKALEEKKMAIHSLSYNYRGLLNHPGGQEFFTVDNMNDTDSDLDPLRKHLQVVFDSVFKHAKLRIHPTQLLLGVVLRKEFDIVTMKDAIRVGRRALNMGEEEVRFTIWYLDYGVGALIYHPEIEDEDGWFVTHIICSPQVVFNSISALITESLLVLHSDGHCSRFNEEERENWKYKGQFSLDTVKHCHSEKNEEKVREGKLIPVEKLIKLLEHSNLLAQIEVKDPVTAKKKKMCFIPAILECGTPEELSKSPPPDVDTPASVKITFEPQYIPIGVFCATISRLVSKGSEGILGMKWELVDSDDSSVKRNLVTFRVDSAEHSVTLVAHINSIEIRLIRQDRSITVHDLASYVLSTVIYVIKEINSLVTPIIAFDCESSGQNVDKMCMLDHGVTPCFKYKKKKVKLTGDQERWFVKDVELNSRLRLKALPYAEEVDSSLTFMWLKDGSVEGTGNELKLEKVTKKYCEGYFVCKIHKNGEPFFNVYHCCKAAGEPVISKNDQLLDEVREALHEARSDWYSLAVEVDIDYGTRKTINYSAADVCFHVLLRSLVERASPDNPWAALVRALRSPTINRHDLADDIEAEQDVGFDDEENTDGCIPSGPLNIDKHLKMVRAATWDARAQWNKLAVELDIFTGDRDAIEHDHRGKVGPCFTALLEQWLTQSSPPPTLDGLIQALNSQTIERGDIADKVEALKNN